MLLMSLEVLGEEFLCFPGRDWEGVCRKLLPLVKLYEGRGSGYEIQIRI